MAQPATKAHMHININVVRGLGVMERAKLAFVKAAPAGGTFKRVHPSDGMALEHILFDPAPKAIHPVGAIPPFAIADGFN
jgi:hypothetical protein